MSSQPDQRFGTSEEVQRRQNPEWHKEAAIIPLEPPFRGERSEVHEVVAARPKIASLAVVVAAKKLQPSFGYRDARFVVESGRVAVDVIVKPTANHESGDNQASDCRNPNDDSARDFHFPCFSMNLRSSGNPGSGIPP